MQSLLLRSPPQSRCGPSRTPSTRSSPIDCDKLDTLEHAAVSLEATGEAPMTLWRHPGGRERTVAALSPLIPSSAFLSLFVAARGYAVAA